MNKPKCPYCGEINTKPTKSWSYQTKEVSRYKCKCGKSFNLYIGKESSYTIPKNKNHNKK